MEKTTLYCTYSNFGKDAIMFINRTTLNNGTEIYSSDDTKVIAKLKKKITVIKRQHIEIVTNTTFSANKVKCLKH